MVKYLRISSYIRKPFLKYNFATAPFWIQKMLFSFLLVQGTDGSARLPTLSQSGFTAT